MFHFDGGSPPWTSGLSQGTALQVLARAWSRFKEPAYLTAAQQALGIFETPPPQGVRVEHAGGRALRRVHLRAQRQHPQRLHPGAGRALRLHVDHQGPARAGAVRSRRRRGARRGAAATTPAPGRCTTSSGNPTSTTTNCSPNSSSTSANARARRPRQPAPTRPPRRRPSAPRRRRRAQRRGVQIPGDEIYCTTAQRFSADLHTPPVIALLSTTLPGGARAGVQLSLSKISTVSLTVRQGSRVVWTQQRDRRTRRSAGCCGSRRRREGPSRSRSPRPIWRATSPRRPARSWSAVM